MHIELSNQRVLVTAGAQGIGLAIAQAFVTAGSQVHICDVNAEFLATAKQLLPGVSQTLCDVSREDQVQAMFQALGARWGGLDALINNAGIAGRRLHRQHVIRCGSPGLSAAHALLGIQIWRDRTDGELGDGTGAIAYPRQLHPARHRRR